ncbi:hypothetical protein Tco_0610620, partial [Tanacetum coccineum]
LKTKRYSMFQRRPIAKGVGLRVADSHIGNHPEDDFMPLETIRRLCSIFGRRSHLGFKGETSDPKGMVPLHPELDPLYDQISTYPCHVRTFPDPILYLAGLKNSWKHSPKKPVIYYQGQGMDFRSFMMQEINGEFKFLPEGCIDDNQGSPSSKSVNNEALVIDAKPLTSLHPSNFVEDVADSDDASARDNENPLLGTALPPLPKAGKKLRSLGKRKLPSGVGDSLLKVQKMAAQASKVADEASDPLNVDSDADIVARELEKNRAYVELERKCNEALLNLNQNALVADLRTEIETLQGRVDGLHSECTRLEMDVLKQDRASVIAKVVPDAAIKLIHIDEMEVAKLKEPFVMEKMAGYRPSSKQEYDQAGDDLANASYPFLFKYVNDPYASLEQLLLKKPESFRSKPSYVKAK